MSSSKNLDQSTFFPKDSNDNDDDNSNHNNYFDDFSCDNNEFELDEYKHHLNRA